MKIVTGHRGENHVTSTDTQALNQGIFGTGNYILDIGNKFAATMPDATHITIQDGEGVMQGVHFRTERGTADTVNIDAGATGVNRIDLVGALYEKDNEGVESVSWSVVKGTAVSGNPTEPTYETGDILVGDSPVFFPMYKITLTGVTPVLTEVAKDIINTKLRSVYFHASYDSSVIASGNYVGECVSDSITLEKGSYLVVANAEADANGMDWGLLYIMSGESPSFSYYGYGTGEGHSINAFMNCTRIITVDEPLEIYAKVAAFASDRSFVINGALKVYQL